MNNVFKSAIEWRSDIPDAPKNRRVLMIAMPIIPNHANVEPEIVVAHWHEGSENWVIADILGEPRTAQRLELKPLYWANLGNLPPGIILRRLDIEDFKG